MSIKHCHNFDVIWRRRNARLKPETLKADGKLHSQQLHTPTGRVKCFKRVNIPLVHLLLFFLFVYTGYKCRHCYSGFY
ncbi:hypothetical protein JOB18_022412 [Solea senegalensis]|uniref:Uncharacterized protein n=1 Tax=Solea senegalensis TaxID=28829 RepID=A0AAV6SE64_SOLSE|nr:hypothetical protein JOB18_022412 [Solea senegalensis]